MIKGDNLFSGDPMVADFVGVLFGCGKTRKGGLLFSLKFTKNGAEDVRGSYIYMGGRNFSKGGAQIVISSLRTRADFLF